jgi:broad specificity phosphatase PhoE
MRAAIDAAFLSVESGDVVLVSHQLPIWVTHLALAGERFPHDPRKRRCSLSSITTIEQRRGDDGEPTLVEVGYVEPARVLQAAATDVGAV